MLCLCSGHTVVLASANVLLTPQYPRVCTSGLYWSPPAAWVCLVHPFVGCFANSAWILSSTTLLAATRPCDSVNPESPALPTLFPVQHLSSPREPILCWNSDTLCWVVVYCCCHLQKVSQSSPTDHQSLAETSSFPFLGYWPTFGWQIRPLCSLHEPCTPSHPKQLSW